MRDIHSREFKIPGTKLYNEETNKFITTPETTLTLRHSLISISEWEMKYGVPYMKRNREWTEEQTLYYLKCMTVGDIPGDEVYLAIPRIIQADIQAYVNADMTATVVEDISNSRKNNNQEVTSELIYAWMILLQIPPIPFETWHLNRLLTLIKTVNAEQAPKKKKSEREILNAYADINERNKAKFASKR